MTLATTVNLTPTVASPTATPSPPSGQQAIVFANDGGAPTVNFSATDPIMEGDTGSGGLAGNVPAPAAGTAAAGKFLRADGIWAVPPGSGIGTFYDEVITMTGTSGAFSHSPTTLAGLFKNGQRLTQLGSAPDFSIAGGTDITLTVSAVSGDFYEAVYWH